MLGCVRCRIRGKERRPEDTGPISESRLHDSHRWALVRHCIRGERSLCWRKNKIARFGNASADNEKRRATA